MIRRNALLTLSAATAPLLAGGAAAAAPELSATAYERETLAVGGLALLTSRVALDRATNAQVRQFARFEADEQLTVAQVLTDQQNPPPPPLTAAQRRTLARLRTLSGATFNREYILDQIVGHQELLRIQRAYVRTGSNRDLLHIARLNVSRIEEHLVELGEIRASL